LPVPFIQLYLHLNVGMPAFCLGFLCISQKKDRCDWGGEAMQKMNNHMN